MLNQDNSIPSKLRELADEMADIGLEMTHTDWISPHMSERGHEMIGAANIARQWADAIEEESED